MANNKERLANLSEQLEDSTGQGINADVSRIIQERNAYRELLKSNVTGVKGAMEVTYRTGDVNLTPGQLGLGNVINEKQYCATNPPPYPVVSVNGKTGEVAFSIDLSLDPQTYQITTKLLDQTGAALSSSSVDLPLETMVVSAQYKSETKEIELTLQNGEKLTFSVSDLVSGLVSQETFDAHVNNKENPHNVTSTQIGLGKLSGGAAGLYLRKASEADNDFSWSTVEITKPTVLSEEEYAQLVDEGRVDPTMVYYILGTSDNRIEMEVTATMIATALGLTTDQLDNLVKIAKIATVTDVNGVSCLSAPGFNTYN